MSEQRPSKKKVSQKRIAQMERVCELASELCNAIDAENEDIGGHRSSMAVLIDLGDACDKLEGRR